MSESLQPGLHPHPDTLGAFVEGMLPEHERVQCMAHLAECTACREVVYLAEEPVASDPAPVPVVPEKVSFWKRWLRPIPVLTFATAVGTLVLSFSLYEHLKSIPKAPTVVAIATPPPAPEPEAALASAPTNEVEMTLRVQKREPSIAPKYLPAIPARQIPTKTDTPLTAPAASAPQPVAIDGVAPLRASAAPMAAPAKPAAPTGVAGTITDAAGGAIPNAEVKLRPLTSPAAKDLATDPKGQFNVAGLEPGPYEMQVLAKGFQQMTRQVEVQPNQIARADSILQVGSVSETISVTAESAQVQTETGKRSPSPSLMAGGRGGGGGGARGGRSGQVTTQAPALSLDAIAAATPLPNKLPAPVTITKGKVMLTTDSAGALLLSANAGKKWKTVKPVWRGRVTGLVVLSAFAASDPVFQLTTDVGATWLSRDGSHWYAAPK